MVNTEVLFTAAVNLCNQDILIGEEMMIDFTYTYHGRQMMILDIGAPVSIVGVSWMKQYWKQTHPRVFEFQD